MNSTASNMQRTIIEASDKPSISIERVKVGFYFTLNNDRMAVNFKRACNKQLISTL